MSITGTLTNSGNFELLGPGDAATLGSLTNSAGGVVDVEGGSTPTISGAVDNAGALATNLQGSGGGNTVTVNGLLTNEATGQINLNGPGALLQALAGLSSNGAINVNNGSAIDPPFVNNGGTINIDSLSKMIVGNPAGLGYIQLADGTLGEIINPTGYGVINVNGSALRDGTLNILLKPGFNPAVGSMYTFLFANPGQINGTFATLLNDIFNGGTEEWLVTYDNADSIPMKARKARALDCPEDLCHFMT